MAEGITYDNYSRNELIELLHFKNKQIDSQRAMLYQSRARRNELRETVKQAKKENLTLSGQFEKLEQKNTRLMESSKWKTWSMKQFAPVMMNTIIAYNKLKRWLCYGQ